MSTSDPESGPGEHPEFPSPDRLSYSHRDIRLSRAPIDWEMLKPKEWDKLSETERQDIIREQNRRLYFSIQGLAKELNPLLDGPEGDKLSDRMNMLLNPDQYPHYHEDPEVGPAEEPGGR